MTRRSHIRDMLNGLYVAWVTIAMDWQDGGRSRGDSRLDLARVHVEGIRIDIDERWLDAIPQ